MKQHSQDSYEQANTQTVRSCQPIILEDIINSNNKPKKFVRVTKSQQNFNESDKWSRLDLQQKQEYIEQTNQHLRGKKKIMPDIKNIGTEFPADYVDSEEISIDGQSYRSNSLKDKAEEIKNNQNQFGKIQNQQDKNYSQEAVDPQLNILIAGGQDTGKTTFIQCFFNNSRKNNQKFIKQKTKQLTILNDLGIKFQDEYNIKNRQDFIDMPGFQHNEVSSYIKKIWTYALQKSQKYEKLRLSHKQKRYKDERIHCCLYFMAGPRIKQADCKAIKQLSLIFNLIPVISKADSYTLKQIKEIKQNFNQIKIHEEFNLYDIKEFFAQKYPEKVKQIENGPFEKAPPFVISASLETIKLRDYDQKHVRQYKWGTCQIQNQNHSDFKLLKNLLTHQLRKDLIENTRKIQNSLNFEQQSSQKQSNSSNFLKISIIGLVSTGALLLAGYKLGVYNKIDKH